MVAGVSGNVQETVGKVVERVKGIEPSYSAWKAAALPLSYTRVFMCQVRLVEGVGFEPT